MPALPCVDSGIPGSPAIVFLHGVGGSGAMWAGHTEALSSFHCLAPDLPGFGRNRATPWVSLGNTAALVADLIRTRLPAGRGHVVGLSLGGAVAHTLLARHPEVLLRVIIDGAGVTPAWSSSLIAWGVAAISPFLHTRPVVNGIAQAFGLDEQAKSDLRAASPRSFRRAFSDANGARLSREEVAALCPTLLVAGEHEMKALRASNASLAALMPHAEARYAPGFGHGWLGRAPDLHRRMVEAWITGAALPSELVSETMPWKRPKVDRLLGR
ncbi:MAG: alpha/beta hydrolase [Thermoanaerobaculaceae bacterium]|jgi:pimeloyl-ACP methyl ester carboxylesterase|nr:alpha/beta hydrolase [Thermoanaerobaculaceae bacterium]